MTYYVAPNGNDDAAGTAPGTAWRTLARASTVELGPGDSLLLEASGRWNEPLLVRGRGTADAPAEVGAYRGEAADRSGAARVRAGWDDGFAALPRPCISWHEGPVVTLSDASHLILRGLEIECTSDQTLYPGLDGVDQPERARDVARHPDHTVNYGVLSVTTLAAANGRPDESVTVEDLYVHGRGPDQNSEGILISVETSADADAPTLRGAMIRNCLVEDVGWRGIGTGVRSINARSTGVPWLPIAEVVIEGNAARRIGLQGICAFNAHGVVMRRNLVDGAGRYQGVGAKWGPAGLWPWSCADVLIEHNEVTGMADGNTGADATGIDIDWNSHHVVVRENHCYGNAGCGIVTMSCHTSSIERNRVEANLGKVNLGPGQIGLCDYQTAVGPHAITGVTDVTIVDNLVILDRDNTTALSTVKTSEGPQWSGVTFTGNRVVFFDHAAGQYAYDIAKSTRVDRFDRNSFYGCDAERFRAVEAGRESGWSEWRDSGRDASSEFLPLDDTAPSRVRDLAARRTGAGVELGWAAAADNRSGVHHYNVYRGTRSGFDRRYLTLVGQSTDTRFIDPEPPEGERWYAVEAEDACGNRSGHVETHHMEVAP